MATLKTHISFEDFVLQRTDSMSVFQTKDERVEKVANEVATEQEIVPQEEIVAKKEAIAEKDTTRVQQKKSAEKPPKATKQVKKERVKAVLEVDSIEVNVVRKPVHHLTEGRVGVNQQVVPYVFWQQEEAWQKDCYSSFYNPEAVAVNPYREATLEEVLGHETTLMVDPKPLTSSHTPLTEEAPFQGLVLVLAMIYAMLFYYNLSDIKSLLARLTRNSGHQNIFEESTGSSFSSFLSLTTTIGLLFLGIAVVKYGDVIVANSFLSDLPYGVAFTLSLLVSVVGFGIILWQWLVLRVIGLVTLSTKFIHQIQQIRKVYFAFAVVIISPTLLLFTLTPQGEGKLWFFLTIIELALAVILYLRETFGLFISKKISILHWFLYLCTVEIFPISLMGLIVIK